MSCGCNKKALTDKAKVLSGQAAQPKAKATKPKAPVKTTKK